MRNRVSQRDLLQKTNLVISFLLLFLFAAIFAAWADLEYRNRGNYDEGIKPQPVSGYYIELISMLIDYKEEVEQLPNLFKLKFYLHEFQLLFHIGLKFKSDLDNENISKDLRHEFEDNFGAPLSQNIMVSIGEEGSEWLIHDGDYQQAYIIRTAENQLNVYESVYLTVRELDYKYYYWLDNVRPPKPWQSGTYNGFEWSTQDVIQKLGDLRMEDLGVVARIGEAEPAGIERVAPVIFYHSKLPDTIKGYRFTFYGNGNFQLTCSVYKEGNKEVEDEQNFPTNADRPFLFKWNSSKAAEGAYKLVISGYVQETGDRIDQIVEFYHKPMFK